MQFPTNKLHSEKYIYASTIAQHYRKPIPRIFLFFRAALCFKVGGMNEEEEEERVLGALRSSDESPKKEEEKKDWDNGGWEGGGYQKEQGGRGGGEVHKTRRIWQVY